MHLMNILNQHKATEAEKKILIQYFTNNTVTHSSAVEELKKLRNS
jgi:hydroxymethylglutaryl-CoA reductase